jgi:hypothetical protein
MAGPTSNKPCALSWTVTCTTVWILLSAGWSIGLIALSCFGQLNRGGNAVLLALGVFGSIYGYYRLNGNSWKPKGLRWRRFRRPFPILYLLCALAAVIGGAIHAPTNYDAFCYRIPRILQWLAEGRWHWIGGADPRMDFSGVGFEAMMVPPLAALHTLRFAFLINVVCFLLFPGLIFSVLSALGVRKSVAWTWMWILPCASCFVMEAGSIGNDFPACVYVLAALLFGTRAIRSGRKTDIMLAILSAALMTSVKASNLPLLLPIAICLATVMLKHPRLIATAAVTSCLAGFVSFLPIAVANLRHTGDWTGQPNSLLKLQDPIVGLAGNALMLGSASFVPAVFPQAEKLNTAFNSRIPEPGLRWIKEGFADFRMTHPQLASEENSGLGLGVSAALLLGLAGAWRNLRAGRLFGLGGMVFAGFWIALLFYMIKLGNCGVPRLVAPYYAGLLGLPLLSIKSGTVFSSKWWRWSSLILLLPILPALVCNPARPLLPMTLIVDKMMGLGVATTTLSRMKSVYEVYANRADPYDEVRTLLPSDATSIAFAGTPGESQYSFWLPLGTKRVTDFTPLEDGAIPNSENFDVIVASNWGTQDRFGISPQDLADRIDWTITGTASVRTLASVEEGQWSVLVPKTSVKASR